MDYTNFVKTYYRTALAKLNKYSSYSGTFNTMNGGLNIQPQYLHNVVPNLDVLPSFELNIDAPLSEYEKFMEYYATNYPELGIGVFLGKTNLYDVYNEGVSKGILNSDEKAISYINLMIDIGISVLVKKGILK